MKMKMKTKLKFKDLFKIIAGYLYAAVFVLVSVFEIYTAVKFFSLISEATGWWVLLLFVAAVAMICWAVYLIRCIGKTCFIGLKVEFYAPKDLKFNVVVHDEDEGLEECSGEDCDCTFEELLADGLCKEEENNVEN